MIIGIDNDKLQFIADSNGKLVVTLENLTDAIVKKELLQNCVITRCKDCKFWMKNPYRESSVFGLCFKHKDIAIASDETDWCSWAERKDNETD